MMGGRRTSLRSLDPLWILLPLMSRRLFSCKSTACTFPQRVNWLHSPSGFGARRLHAPTQGRACRVRESGMPPMDYWETLLDAEATLDKLNFASGLHQRVIEFGCGYGTFSIPVARRVQQLVTFDLEERMVDTTQSRASSAGLENVKATVRDVVDRSYGVDLGSCDAALLMNILHCEDPIAMMRDAALALAPGEGRLYATHWRYAETPRGPPLEIRPRPEELEIWALETGLLRTLQGPVDCPPWHYGWVFQRL